MHDRLARAAKELGPGPIGRRCAIGLLALLCCQVLSRGEGMGQTSLLDRRTTIILDGQALGAALQRLGSTLGVPLWVDRRVDVGAPASIAARDESVAEILRQLGTPKGLAAKETAGVVYFGPAKSADELATLLALARQQVNGLAADRRSRWLARRASSWSALSEPRRLVSDVAEAAGARLSRSADVPHDLWPARELPPMAAIDRLTLLLIGFDLAPQISRDGRELSVAPMRRPVEIVRLYGATGKQAAAVQAVVDESPEPKPRVEHRAGRLQVSARWEVHERIAELAANRAADPTPAPAQPAPNRKQVYTITIQKKPLGAVLEQLGTQIGFAVEWDDALARAKPQAKTALVSCQVERATLDELLAALLEPAGLSHTRKDGRVTIRAK